MHGVPGRRRPVRAQADDLAANVRVAGAAADQGRTEPKPGRTQQGLNGTVHVIDGQLVSSRYGHMLVGSLRVSPGDVVKVGTVLGNTGNTGRSTGVHTHFEVLLGGTTAVDPITWLRQNAGRDSLG